MLGLSVKLTAAFKSFGHKVLISGGYGTNSIGWEGLRQRQSQQANFNPDILQHQSNQQQLLQALFSISPLLIPLKSSAL